MSKAIGAHIPRSHRPYQPPPATIPTTITGYWDYCPACGGSLLAHSDECGDLTELARPGEHVTTPNRPTKPGRKPITPYDGDPRHGTPNGYANHACTCQPCRTAWTNYIRTRRHSRQQQTQAQEPT